jgi:hypothetical protein
MSKQITARAAKTIIAAVISASCLGAVTTPAFAAMTGSAAHAATISSSSHTIAAAAPADDPDGPIGNPWG